LGNILLAEDEAVREGVGMERAIRIFKRLIVVQSTVKETDALYYKLNIMKFNSNVHENKSIIEEDH
jgi:hypothetical protein